MKSKNYIFYIIGAAIIFLGGVFYLRFGQASGQQGSDQINDNVSTVVVEPVDYLEKVAIDSGSTFGVLMAQSGINSGLAQSIYDAAKPVYDLANIRVGHFLELTFTPDASIFKGLVYKIDSEKELRVDCKLAGATEKDENLCTATVEPIAYDLKTVVKEGTIETSLYEAALADGVDERAIIALADAFQWSVDFAMDPRVGDTFKFIYEERYLNGEYQMPGKILAGQYVNAGKKYQVYYFKEDDNNEGYFDEQGNSVQKLFLKAPVAFKYISSGFTTGLRYVEAFNVSTGHRAIDYAAAYGTPIRTVGDGTVIMASYNGAYGNMVKIRHNGTYQTNYGHMSKFAVKKGDKVKQGDVIGYVGSTGFSTGPHVHYEMEKNGVKINPLLEVLPPGQAISSDNQDRFFNSIKEWQTELDN